jgi:HSP20 family protein
MSDLPARQQHRGFWPEVNDLLAGLPTWANLRPAFGGHVIKVEDELTDGEYRLRAEIPGVDPAKDLEVTVRDGVLSIRAERNSETKADGRSEFSYGSFARSMSLPAGADEDKAKASYDNGILTVTVPVQESGTQEKRVPIESKS